MRNRMRKIGCFVLLIILAACSSVYQLTIEVQEPASITLPADIGRVVIVNNTVPQPGDVGIFRTLLPNENRIENEELRLDLDSVSWITMYALAFNTEEARFFDNVSRYKKSIRTDDEWMSSCPLSQEFKKEAFDNQKFDAIISIDKLLFSLEEQVKKNGMEKTGSYFYAFADNRVGGELSCSIYLYNKDLPFSSFIVSDSLIYKSTLYADSLEFLKELPESLIYDLAYSLGEKLARNITPSWTTRERMIYVETGSRMQEAFSYSKKGNWLSAEALWLELFDTRTKDSDKAKLSHNIAVANEMQDKLEAALRWAEKAKTYFPESAKTDAYISELEKRIQNSGLLDMQWGEESR